MSPPRAHLQVIDRHPIVASEVKHRVKKRRGVAVGENEAVARDPLGILGVIFHDFRVQHVSDRRAAHRRTRVTGVSLLNNVSAHHADCVDATGCRCHLGNMKY